jgi:hypothetical protein
MVRIRFPPVESPCLAGDRPLNTPNRKAAPSEAALAPFPQRDESSPVRRVRPGATGDQRELRLTQSGGGTGLLRAEHFATG